jgi:four helix bundle protein
MAVRGAAIGCESRGRSAPSWGMKPYERLLAWRVSHELALAVYGAASQWPRDEVYGLTPQARRAAYSIPMNIAEGSAKRGTREFRRFPDISLGSHSELSCVLTLAHDLGYLTEADFARLAHLADRAGKLIWCLYARLKPD